MENQYFTKGEQVPKEFPKTGGAGVRPHPLFSGLYKLFRDLLKITDGCVRLLLDNCVNDLTTVSPLRSSWTEVRA